jgi:DNA-binding transcriptional MerR regulator
MGYSRKGNLTPTHNTPSHTQRRLFGSGHLLRTQRLILQDLQSPSH